MVIDLRSRTTGTPAIESTGNAKLASSHMEPSL